MPSDILLELFSYVSQVVYHGNICDCSVLNGDSFSFGGGKPAVLLVMVFSRNYMHVLVRTHFIKVT